MSIHGFLIASKTPQFYVFGGKYIEAYLRNQQIREGLNKTQFKYPDPLISCKKYGKCNKHIY